MPRPITRRAALGGLAAGAAPMRLPPAAAAAAAAPAFAPDLPARLAAAEAAGLLPGLHGVVAMQGARLALEHYWTGEDARWGTPLGRVAFGPEVLHDLRSVTKSLVGLLYGISLGRGQVPPPEAPLLEQFPEHRDLAAARPELRALRVAHVLTMTLGQDWNEDLPYTDPRNSEIAMERAPDRLRFVLERPVLAPPGERWTYGGGATALLGALIARGTGLRLEEAARAALFGPLGLGPSDWTRGRDGTASAASGLRLAPRDLARIGAAILRGGRGPDGAEVIPGSWLAASFRPAAVLPDGRRYGFHWYLGRFPRQEGAAEPFDRWIGAFGNGGQRLFVFPDLDLAIAVAAGNYDRPDQGRPPAALVRQVLLPALLR